MDRWEAIVERPIDSGQRLFEKTIQTATVVLKNEADLAPFETEWVVNTLLYKPVNLLQTISEKRREDCWTKPLSDAFKLLASLVTECAYVEKYFEDIVNLCHLTYDAELRKHALNCLTQVVKKSELGAQHAPRYISALEEASQCKTPLALLVGAICEHHPSIVCSDVSRIWRTYLNMLENHKNTDTVTKAILEGICGLFKHFGEELPTSELNDFYDSLSYVHIKKCSCLSVCFETLRSYASLFRERISLDKPIRDTLWLHIGEGSETAILNVYKVVCHHVEKKVMEKIIATEVLPHTQSTHTRAKLTSLRILTYTRAKINSFGDLAQYIDVQTLEGEFRRDKVTHGDADMVAWCMEANLPNSERLLQASILFYHKLPATIRKRIVVNGILNSPNIIRQAAIHFLITQSCSDIDRFIQIWRDLFAVSSDDDWTVKSETVTIEFSNYLVTVLEMFLEERGEFEDLPPKLSSLLLLTSKVVPLFSTGLPYAARLLCELGEHYLTSELIAALRVVLLTADVEESHGFYKSLRIEGCRDEATLHESCLALLQAPNSVQLDASNMMFALQIIFSSDVEPKILCDGLKKLDYLLNNEILDPQDVRNIMRLVQTLRSKGDKTDRQIRILHREVLMFIGKHGNTDLNNNANDPENAVVVNLKKSLTLNLPHDGAMYKVNLQKILLLALHQEDPKALQILMTMLCANLTSNNELSSQLALTRVIQKLAKVHASGSANYTESIQQAIEMCNDAECIRDILQYISTTKSCGVRKLLSTALTTLCEEADTLQVIVEQTNVMLASSDSTTKKAGLDIAETIISSIENNISLSKSVLPQLLVSIARTFESDAKTIFNLAANTFIDKKELFEKETKQQTAKDLMKNLTSNVSDVKTYKTTVKMTVDFVKGLPDVNVDFFIDVIFDTCQSADVKMLYILYVVKSVYNFDNDVSRKVLGRNNSQLISSLFNFGDFKEETDYFELEAVLRFLEEYCEIILELKYMDTIQFLSEIIQRLTPKSIKKLRKNIKQCFSRFKKQCKDTPKPIKNCFQTWTEKLPLKKITDALEREYFPLEHIMCVNAFKIMSKIFDTRHLFLSDVKFDIAKWPKIMLKSYSSGRLTEYFYNEKSYFNDILTVSLKFLTLDDVKKLIKEGSGMDVPTKDIGVMFCGYFIEAFSDVLIEEPFLLLDNDLKSCSVVLNDLLKHFVKMHCTKECKRILELVDKLWPSYEATSSFAQKHSLLTNLECLPEKLHPDSNVYRWVLETVCSREAKVEEKIKMASFIPETAFSSPRVITSVSSLFPARFRELRPELLETIAIRPCVVFVEMLAALVANDSTSGWWDEALDSCLSSLATRNSLELSLALYSKCERASVCTRLLAPLLRYSTPDICERFLSKVLKKILTFTRPKMVKANLNYQKCMDDYVVNLSLLLVAFEKLPTSSLEASSSPLYSNIIAPTPWHIVREALVLCHSLRDSQDIRCPEDATAEFKDSYRQFQCVLYNCYCAAICRRRPSEKIYTQVFNESAWGKIVDEHKRYELPVKPSWIKRSRSVPVAVQQESTALLSSHSHIFLRTLSEDPMLFDLHTQQQEATEIQDISLSESDLNQHPCAATLTALCRHVAALPFTLWRHVAGALERGGNVGWLLAQVVCNCKEELKPHASVLLPGLLAVLADTVAVNGNKCFNGLHLDVLDTILYWKEETTSPQLNIIAHHLITTCMEYRKRNVFDGLVRTTAQYLEVYGSAVTIQWTSFEAYYEDESQDTNKAILQLIRIICKNKIYIPRLLDKILAKFEINPSKMAECFGLALAVCQNATEKEEALSKYKKFLYKCNVTNYVKVLYYSCMGYADCCGELEFRKITDYVTKVTSYDRTKCLHILSVYLSNSRPSAYINDMFDTVDLSEMIVNDHAAMMLIKNGLHLMPDDLKRRLVLQIADMCQHSTVKVRMAALDVMLKAFEELFPQTFRPPPKRQRTESTPILSMQDDFSNTILTSLGRGAADASEEVTRAVRDGVAAKLDRDLGVRFAECFYIVIYLPSLSENNVLDLSVCVSAILEMLYSHMRNADTYKNMKLREEPLVVRESKSSKLLTLSKAFQGTFSSYSSAKSRQTNKTQDSNKPSIDIQVPIDDILETMLAFCQTTPQAARALFAEALHSVLAGSRFELGASLVPLLGAILHRPSDVTPLCVDVCRVLVGTESVACLLDPVENLRTLTANTEAAFLTSLLYEEVKMRYHGDELFQLGEPENTRDVVMDETTVFSMEDMKCMFGKLSNWDNLTIQQKSFTQKSALPPLWTEKSEFVKLLDSYEVPANAESWFDKMAASYKQETGPNSMAWLRNMDKWPRRHFEISAITEAASWRHAPCDVTDVHRNIFTTDECLAEWAARLMIRSSYYNSLQLSEAEHRIDMLSRSHELKWCVRANEMGIPNAVLDCVRRNVEELCENEAIPWLLQKLTAHRHVALDRNDRQLLGDVLEKAKTIAARYSLDSNENVEMCHLELLLHKDLNSLSYHELQPLLQEVSTVPQGGWSKAPKAISSVFEIAMGFYDDSWDSGTLDHDSVLSNMSHVLSQAADRNVSQVDMLLAILLNRLQEYSGKLDAETSQKLLETLSPLASKLDEFTLDQLRQLSTKLPAHLIKNLSVMVPQDGTILKYKRCLQIVCDSGHLLAYYCGELLTAVKNQDRNLWNITFDRMKTKIYENPYTGPSYKLLDKFKEELYELYEFDTTPTYLSKAESKLTSIGVALRKEPQPTLRLSDLCPTLLDHREGDAGVARLFGLKGVRIVKFYDKIQVFTDSVRRPVVISALLSTGRTLRAIHKTGERLAGDAAARAAVDCARRLCSRGVGAYNVTLLDEDSALIEFLEGYERLRALIESAHNINVLNSVVRPADRNLIEMSMTAALRTHKELCSKVPAYALRSALEQNSSSVDDFISKKRKFTDSLGFMSILIWILGLGDRHLQNIMCAQDGGARCVDWGSVWQHGATELPARLTRNLLAVCDLQVLESRLQSTLASLRASHKLFEAVVKLSFTWTGEQFPEKFTYIQRILRGTTLSHHICRDVTMQSVDSKHRHKHLDLLSCVFRDFPEKGSYSVEEQISCLLRHCTSPELLSVTRAGWEPWI